MIFVFFSLNNDSHSDSEPAESINIQKPRQNKVKIENLVYDWPAYFLNDWNTLIIFIIIY